MCKQFIFWATEYLNYYSLIFWGIKLFLKKYDVKTGRKEWVENVIIIVVSAPVVWFCVFNYKFIRYSNAISHILVVFLSIFIKMYTKRKTRNIFLLSAIYVYGMRLIDLLAVAILLEVNQVSRYFKCNVINIGFARSIFIIFLLICYYIVYRMLMNSYLLEYYMKICFVVG